jgi:hypothetical protein
VLVSGVNPMDLARVGVIERTDGSLDGRDLILHIAAPGTQLGGDALDLRGLVSVLGSSERIMARTPVGQQLAIVGLFRPADEGQRLPFVTLLPAGRPFP